MSDYTCFFCAKPQHQVALMIASPHEGAGICDQCVEICVEIIFRKARSDNLVEMPGSSGGHDDHGLEVE